MQNVQKYKKKLKSYLADCYICNCALLWLLFLSHSFIALHLLSFNAAK